MGGTQQLSGEEEQTTKVRPRPWRPAMVRRRCLRHFVWGHCEAPAHLSGRAGAWSLVLDQRRWWAVSNGRTGQNLGKGPDVGRWVGGSIPRFLSARLAPPFCYVIARSFSLAGASR